MWIVYYRMMHESINLYSNNVPKSPIREILELEPETAQFGKPEKLADGRRVRCTLEIIGKGVFKGELFVCFFLSNRHCRIWIFVIGRVLLMILQFTRIY